MNYFAVNLRSVASFERKKGNSELATLIDHAAQEIERLRSALERIGEMGPEMSNGDSSAVVMSGLARDTLQPEH